MHDVAALRHRLSDLIPRAAGFRTDYARGHDGASRRALVVEYFDQRSIYVVVSEFATQRERSLAQLRGRQMTEAGAAEVLDIGSALASANDYSAWPARTDACARRIAHADGVERRSYRDYPGLGGHYRRLRGRLARTDRIHLRTATGRVGAGTRTKEWVSFLRADGQVQAELAVHLMGPALRHYYNATDPVEQQLAQTRLARWTGQLEVSFRELLAALPELEVLTGIAGVNEIHFHREVT